ncbi:MAG TPA: PKD domain-containing protein [Chthoniobacterales bacterium]|nr:PKD domain-containing protein [Chthoniobacterales bacterium]
MKTRSYIRNSILALGLFLVNAVYSAEILSPFFIRGDSAIRLASGDQTTPEIASGGNVTLAVWQDQRALPAELLFPSFEWETSNDIYGARVDASGKLIDRVPIPVAQEKAIQGNPQVVWNGTNWLVLFESVDVNGTGFYYQNSLEAVRVSAAGVVLDPTPIKIRNVTPAGSSWTAASDGTDWVIAFQESDMNSALDLLRVTAAGSVLQGPTVVVPSTYFLRSNLRLAYANGVFLFTWAEFSDTKSLRFDAAFNVLDPAPKTLVAGHIVTDLTSSGTQFYAVWTQPVSFVEQVTGSRISTAGVLLDGSGVVISNNSSKPDAFAPPFVTWDGINFKVTWASASKLFLARVSPDGVVLDPGGVLVPGPMSGPTASAGGGTLQVVWSVLQNSEFDTLSAQINAGNVAGRTLSIGSGAPAQTRSDVAVGVSGSMIAFRSDFSGTNRIMAQPVDFNGRSLTREPIQLDSASNTNPPSAPSVAWNGTLYLVTWGNASGIVAQRMNQDGTLIDPAPFFVMPGFGPTEVSAVGSTFLVIARQFINNNPELIIPVVSRVNGDTGAVLDPAGFSVGNSFCISVSVTSVTDRWMAVFRSNTTHDNPVGSTYGTFVNTDGTKSSTFVIYGPSGAPGNGITEVAVASDGTKALALQSAPVSSTVETDLIGVIVNADGTHQPAVNLTPWLGNQYSPKAVWNGTHYVVVFNDQINRFALFTLNQLDSRSDLFGMRVTAAGAKVDPMGFVFSASQRAEGWPNVSAGTGRTLLSGSVLLNQRLDSYRVGYQYRGANANQWPVAVATATPDSGNIPLSVNFSSAGSTDLDGSIASYFWDFGDGATSTSANPQHTYTAPGEYVATLTVTDNLGVSTTNTAAVEVMAPNQNPVAKFVVTPPTGKAPLNVTLTSDGSYDPDGALGNFEWHFSDGGTYFGRTAFHTFTRAGTYTISLTVFDNRGGSGTSQQTIVVQ